MKRPVKCKHDIHVTACPECSKIWYEVVGPNRPDPTPPKQEDWEVRLSMLRQWLNEDRITDARKMVTNQELQTWLDIPSLLREERIATLEKAREALVLPDTDELDAHVDSVIDQLIAQERGDSPSEEPTHKP